MTAMRKPLEGVRVIDLCVVWAGPFATMMFGDLGAEVIKAENPFVLQPATRGAFARPPLPQILAADSWHGGYPGNVPGERPWNYCPTFVSIYRNKRSFSVDLRRPEGMDILGRLVAISDVVYENNASDLMEKLGITYEWLTRHNPRIIFVRAPAYGSTGPYRNARAFGVHLEAVIGHTLMRGYEDADASTTTAIYSGDYLAACQGAFATMAALWQRERTGKGQLIEIGQAENASPMFTQAMMDFSLNGRSAGTMGNRDIHGHAPCGVYPARSPGTVQTSEDHWIAIHVEGDAHWMSFVDALGTPDWALDPRYATNAGRAEHWRDLDRHIGSVTKGFEDYDLMRRLQAVGISAMPVLEASRIFDDPHMRARGFFRKQTVEGAGTHEYVGPMWNLTGTPITYDQPPVQMGEHNDYVYRELLKVSDEEYERLAAAGHISMDFDPSIP